MNKELKSRVFDIPKNILHRITQAVNSLGGQHVHGLQRAKKLLSDKTVKYGQLKRIIHDFQNMDKNKERVRYDNWAKQYLQGERDLISNKKDSRKRADEIGAITGERKNSHIKKHSKKPDFLPPLNLVKSNSHKSSISPIVSLGLFEEIKKFKKLINY
jgi:hypothetical protein